MTRKPRYSLQTIDGRYWLGRTSVRESALTLVARPYRSVWDSREDAERAASWCVSNFGPIACVEE